MEEVGEERKRLAWPWRLVIFIVGFGVVQIAISVIAVVGGLVYFGFEDVGAVAAQLQSQEILIPLQILVALPTLLLAMAWIFLCRKFLDRRPFLTLGLDRPTWGWPKTVVLGMAAGALPITVCVMILWGFDGLGSSGITTSATTWLLFPTLLVMAFYEEIVFRGYMLRNFLESGRVVLGILIPSLIFAVVHGFNPEVWSSPISPINLFGAGVLLSLAYLVSNDLWFPTVLHFAWNITQGLIFELPVSGLQVDGIVDLELTGQLPAYLTGADFGLEASILITLAEVVLCGILYVQWRRQGGFQETTGPAPEPSETTPE